MSLAASMQSWCDNFRNKGADRAKTIKQVENTSHHVVKHHSNHRANMAEKTRDFLNEKCLINRKRVLNLIKRYVVDRSEASEILSAMRGKPPRSYKEPQSYKEQKEPQHHKELKHGY